MIKCPNCGSTTQVKECSSVDIYDDGKHTKVIHYQCGCGHSFFEYKEGDG